MTRIPLDLIKDLHKSYDLHTEFASTILEAAMAWTRVADDWARIGNGDMAGAYLECASTVLDLANRTVAPGCMEDQSLSLRPEPEPREYDPGPEIDDEGGMSEYRNAYGPEPDSYWSPLPGLDDAD
jgi:hypothetical protein